MASRWAASAATTSGSSARINSTLTRAQRARRSLERCGARTAKMASARAEPPPVGSLTDDSGAPTQIGYQFGFFANFRSPQWYAQNFYEFMRQYGQNDLYLDGKPAAQTDAVRQSLQMIYDFTYTYKAYDPIFLNNWFADFPQNRAAMVLAGTWFVPAIRQNNPNVRFGVAPHPVLNPDDRSTYKNIQ